MTIPQLQPRLNQMAEAVMHLEKGTHGHGCTVQYDATRQSLEKASKRCVHNEVTPPPFFFHLS
jgi:hypothetical protein